MDGTSPGYPIEPAAWVGTTAWRTTVGAGALPVDTTTIDLAGLADGAVHVPSCCIIDWPPPGPSPTYVPMGPAPYVPPQHTHYHFAAPLGLSDEDVERIAKRVAELLRGAR